MVDRDPIHQVQRRVTGYHDFRMDGMGDLLMRCRGASVLDVGCNRGMVGYEFAHNGATVVHGVDNWEVGIEVAKSTFTKEAVRLSEVEIAREIFADLRNVTFQFECADLSKGAESLASFGEKQTWDFILLLAIVHKLQRVMSGEDLKEFMRHLAKRCNRYIAFRGAESPTMEWLDGCFGAEGMKRIHTSHLSSLGPGAIWAR